MREVVEQIPILVEDFPSDEMVTSENVSPQLLGIFVGVPAILGKNGVEKVIEMNLGDKEKEMLEISANAVRDVVKLLPY